MRASIASIVLGLVGLVFSAHAAEVAGVKIPDTATLADGTQLILNGAGVRKKFFVKVYAGGLYLQQRADDVDKILADPGGKRIYMHFIYKEVEKGKLTHGWDKGFEKNSTDEEFSQLKSRLARFNDMFDTMQKGEVIRLDYLPNQGTQVWIKEQLKGTIEGADFSRALLKVWLGKKPADGGLKKAMLGKD